MVDVGDKDVTRRRAVATCTVTMAAATAEAVLALGEEHHWHLPICHEVVAVMEGRIGAAAAVRRLMERHLKAEELPR